MSDTKYCPLCGYEIDKWQAEIDELRRQLADAQFTIETKEKTLVMYEEEIQELVTQLAEAQQSEWQPVPVVPDEVRKGIRLMIDMWDDAYSTPDIDQEAWITKWIVREWLEAQGSGDD